MFTSGSGVVRLPTTQVVKANKLQSSLMVAWMVITGEVITTEVISGKKLRSEGKII